MDIHVGILTAPKIDYELLDHGFLLRNVRIGIGFHWDRFEDQEFEGQLHIIHHADNTQTAVNTIDLERYLTSVISSEMASTAPMELLKAHAVIARSWALRAIGHTSHVGFDVCADDHCQRYEGLRRRSHRAIEAVEATHGEVLMYKDEVCDCRYHKCCGGSTEIFSTCWEDIDVPYLRSVECPYCGESLPDSSLNDYDLETKDYHDWEVHYSQQELSRIVHAKSGIDFGLITGLIPLQRGLSGRISQLRIEGTKRSQIIGKELCIRQWLSPKCLYSSWMDIKHETEAKGMLSFHLIGHGWGHGVGLCQIGAAVMAEQGFTYTQILQHYYQGANIVPIT